MAIKIPRGEIPAPSVGNRGNSMLSAVQNNKIDYDKVTNTIDFIGQKIAAHNTKIETQRIDNKNTLNKALLQGDINSLLEDINNNQKLSTDGTIKSYNGFYESSVKKLEDKYKKIYKNDDDAFAIWQSQMYTIFNGGAENMRTTRRKKVLAEAQINFQSGTTTFTENLENQSVTPNIWMSTDLLIKEEKDRFTKAALLGITVDFPKHQKEIEDKVWKKVVSANKNYIDDMTQKPEVDYQGIYNELNSSSTNKYFGKSLPSDKREELLAWAKTRATEQKTMKTNNDARIDNENSVDINTMLGNLRVDKLKIPEGASAEEYLKNIINDAKLTDKTKDSHFAELKQIIADKNSGKATTSNLTHGDPVALNEHFDQIIMGNSTDNVFIQKINQDDRLTAKGKEMLIGWAKDYNENRTEYKDELVSNFMDQFSTTDTGYPAEILSYLRAAKPQIYNELNVVLAEGEKAGISYYSMLGDSTSENYIGWKFIEVYQKSLLENIKKGDFGKVMQGKVTAKDYFGTKRDEIYKTFFDADSELEGNQLAFIETEPEIDTEGNVTKRGTRIVDEKYARFTKRLLDKPQPPKMQIKDKTGQKQSIDEYATSPAYKKYQKDYRKWVYEGDFNSDKIPMLNKYFGVTDMPTTKIKN
jgi:hypothetical protein